MPNINSKPAAAGDKHEVLEDKKRIEKLEKQIVRLQNSYAYLSKKHNAVLDQLNRLQPGGKFHSTNYLLQNTIKRIIIILIPCSVGSVTNPDT